MKQNRRIPFGYRIVGAKVGIHEKEADVVSMIFKLYNEGQTLKRITDTLNEEGIAYHESNPTWNKSMIHRLLSNTRYLGDDTYPQIVDAEVFQQAAQQAENRKKFRPASNLAEGVLENKIFCACGARLHKDATGRWICNDCEMAGMAEKKIMSLICEAFHLIAENPEVIQIAPKEQEYVPSTDILRLNNEIRRRIDLAEPEEAEAVRADILHCALLKYQSFEEDLTPYISRTLCEEFEKDISLEDACPQLIKKTVSSIMLADHDKLQIKLRNGAIITAGRRT